MQRAGSLSRRLAAIVDEARAEVAAGREPDRAALEARLREAADGDDAAVRQALERLDRVLAVARARARLAGPPPAARPRPASAPAPLRRRGPLRSRPTITGTMTVRKHAEGDAVTLSWDPAPRVAVWEVRFSEQPDRRPEYVVRETLTLPGEATSVTLPPLSERPLRVHLLGRGRDGRLVQRAIVSGLTRDSCRERWQRKSAS